MNYPRKIEEVSDLLESLNEGIVSFVRVDSIGQSSFGYYTRCGVTEDSGAYEITCRNLLNDEIEKICPALFDGAVYEIASVHGLSEYEVDFEGVGEANEKCFAQTGEIILGARTGSKLNLSGNSERIEAINNELYRVYPVALIHENANPVDIIVDLGIGEGDE